jgi:hypothetical protein
MSDLQKFLDQVRKASGTPRGRKALSAWVAGYYGKILQFTVDGRSLHVVFTPTGVRFQEGAYAAPDLVIAGAAVEDLARRKFDREAVKEVMKAKRVSVRGNLHEAFAFSKFVGEALG